VFPVQQYVPEFTIKRYEVTIREIAHHVGGIRHYQGLEFMSNVHYDNVRDGLNIFINDPLEFEPGTQYSYSSYGWNLISAAMETASGMDFDKYMAYNVIKPSGMINTMPDDATREMIGRVSFYIQNSAGQNEVGPLVDNSYKLAGGGYLSTSEDLVRFGKAILRNKLLSPESLKESWTPYVLHNGETIERGIGWHVGTDKNKRQWVGHGGGSIGGTSQFLVYPEEEVIVVVLVNLSNAKMDNLHLEIAKIILSN